MYARYETMIPREEPSEDSRAESAPVNVPRFGVDGLQAREGQVREDGFGISICVLQLVRCTVKPFSSAAEAKEMFGLVIRRNNGARTKRLAYRRHGPHRNG